MKIAVIGSRSINTLDLENYLPDDCEEIISGGAIGVDRCAAEYARKHNIRLTEFLPEYQKYGRSAPLIRNEIIVNHADVVFAFWDQKSHGTLFVIQYCKKIKKPCRIFIPSA